MTPSLPQMLLIVVMLVILFKSKDLTRLFLNAGSGIRDCWKNLKESEDVIEVK